MLELEKVLIKGQLLVNGSGVYLSYKAMQKGHDKGHQVEIRTQPLRDKNAHSDDFVLEKSIFSNIFEKDIKRIYIYKKAERLAKAIHLITPAFADSTSLRNRIDAIAIGLVDAAILPPGAARDALSRELLALSSMLGIARTGGLLSSMNADLIAREAHLLLQEVAAYEEPRLFLDEAPTLADIAKRASSGARNFRPARTPVSPAVETKKVPVAGKGHVKDTPRVKDTAVTDRRSSILEIIHAKGGSASIKDISTVIRGVSEKTVQRELIALIDSGAIRKEGERRWSTYYIV